MAFGLPTQANCRKARGYPGTLQAQLRQNCATHATTLNWITRLWGQTIGTKGLNKTNGKLIADENTAKDPQLVISFNRYV